jgi:hypothetical protein
MAALVQGHGSAALDALRHPNGTTPGSRESGTAKSCQRSARRVRLHQEATGRERGRYGTDVGRTGKTNVTASFAVLTKEAVGARAVGCIRYDPAVTEAQIQERAVVELDAPAAQDVRGIGTPLGLQERQMRCIEAHLLLLPRTWYTHRHAQTQTMQTGGPAPAGHLLQTQRRPPAGIAAGGFIRR